MNAKEVKKARRYLRRYAKEHLAEIVNGMGLAGRIKLAWLVITKQYGKDK